VWTQTRAGRLARSAGGTTCDGAVLGPACRPGSRANLVLGTNVPQEQGDGCPNCASSPPAVLMSMTECPPTNESCVPRYGNQVSISPALAAGQLMWIVLVMRLPARANGQASSYPPGF